MTSEIRSGNRLRRVARTASAAATSVIVTLTVGAGMAWGQAIPNPPADGSAPGAVLVGRVLRWLKWAGLTSALAGLLIGSIAMGIGHFGSNYSASSAGRKWLLGGMGAAILAGLSWTI